MASTCSDWFDSPALRAVIVTLIVGTGVRYKQVLPNVVDSKMVRNSEPIIVVCWSWGHQFGAGGITKGRLVV